MELKQPGDDRETAVSRYVFIERAASVEGTGDEKFPGYLGKALGFRGSPVYCTLKHLPCSTQGLAWKPAFRWEWEVGQQDRNPPIVPRRRIFCHLCSHVDISSAMRLLFVSVQTKH